MYAPARALLRFLVAPTVRETLGDQALPIADWDFTAFTDQAVGPVSSDEVQGVVAYILQYGLIVKAPTELMIAAFSTPNSDMFWISQADICALGIKLWSVERDAFVCNG